MDEREKNEAKNRKLNTFAMIFSCSDLDGNTVQFSMAIYKGLDGGMDGGMDGVMGGGF